MAAAAPIADLYKAAYGDYMAAKNPLAIQEFNDLIRAYPNDPLAGNAYFYLGEIDYHTNKLATAIKDYNHVLDQYPGNQKIPAAHLHKAMALLQMKERDAAILEFRALIQRFPNSNEAVQARTKLNGMGVRPNAPPRTE
jgi:tol-pal system protein YbgF